MDGYPGLIHSADDFGINAAGMMITETTISNFHGWDANGIPEFVRGRKAMQYATSIDEFAAIMKEGNTAATPITGWWRIARPTKIANLELGLKNVTLQRTKDGYFVGSNFPIDPKLAAEETTFPFNEPGESANARHVRWEQLMAENKGKIDVAAGQRFLADHYDSYQKRSSPMSVRYAGTSIFPRAARSPGSLPTALPAPCKTKPPTPPWRNV